MKTEIIEEEDEYIKVKVEDINEAVANSLRRAVMVKTPTLSVDTVDIYENNTALFDEVLAHRIGQIPLEVPDSMNEEDTAHLSLDQEGPKTVKAEHLVSEDEESDPVYPETVIVDLKDNQKVRVDAKARLGTGEEHTKHQGGNAGYRKEDDGEYVFRIESTSGYDNRELILEAVESLEDELEEFEEELGNL